MKYHRKTILYIVLISLMCSLSFYQVTSFYVINRDTFRIGNDYILQNSVQSFAKKSDMISTNSKDYTVPNWADIRFKYRKNITIQASKVSGDLVNFPVLIEFYDKDLKNILQPSAKDIIFTDKIGNLLAFEIEKFNRDYNATHGHLAAWVNISLSNKENTIISLYYGNQTISIGDYSEKVWENDYLGVWHLSEISGIRYDSTVNQNDGSPQNYDTKKLSDGQIAGADDFDGVDDYIDTYRTPSEIGLGGKGTKTISAWVNTKKFNEGAIFEFGSLNVAKGYCSLRTTSIINVWRLELGGGLNIQFKFSSIDKWVYFVVNFTDKSIEIYANGQLLAQKEINLNIDDKSTFKIAKWAKATYNGLIDEVRISSSARSSEWIKTEFLNQYKSNDFYIIDYQETDDQEPLVHDFGVEDNGNGSAIFYANVTDEFTSVTKVNIKINNSYFDMTLSENNLWLYPYSEIEYGDRYFFQINNASDIFLNYLSKSTEIKNIIFDADNSPPSVKNAFFVPNSDINPTNITFYAEITEYGTGVDEVFLYYNFEEVNFSVGLLGWGSSKYNNNEDIWLLERMKLLNKSNNNYYYVATVPLTQNKSDWKILYRISVDDLSGNTNENAFFVDSSEAGKEIIHFYSLEPEIPFFLIIFVLILNIISMILGGVILLVVQDKFFHRNQYIRINKNEIISQAERIDNLTLISSIEQHTLGIIVSFFDEQRGPIPLFTIPKTLEKKRNLLPSIAFRSFSNCEFAVNLDAINEAIFNFTSTDNIRLKCLSYSFGLDRPAARNKTENITLTIMIHPEYYHIVDQFVDFFIDKVEKIKYLLDKHPDDRKKIIFEIIELRELISRIILSYTTYYSNGNSTSRL